MRDVELPYGCLVSKVLRYGIGDLCSLIDWSYFFHAWQIPNSQTTSAEAMRLKADANAMLRRLTGKYGVNALLMVFEANSDEDDILLGNVRIPMLRQQTVGTNYVCRCLSDFVRPLSYGMKDKVGVFATAVDADMEHLFPEDVYSHMLVQTLADRLAEAAAEYLHSAVEDVLPRGIRPAVGYPCMPDMSVNFLLDKLCDFKRIGISLTEHGMMRPHAAVSGLMIAHPKSHYFAVGTITEEQAVDYARRRRMDVADIRKFLNVCQSVDDSDSA